MSQTDEIATQCSEPPNTAHSIVSLRSDLYDLFYNDFGQYVIISPKYKNYKITFIIDGREHASRLVEHKQDNHTNIYLTDFLEKRDKIGLKISENVSSANSIHLTDVKVNCYSSFDTRGHIILSTLVKNENDYLIQWIKYHMRIGIHKFVIYDNNPTFEIKELLKDFSNVLCIHWPYLYVCPTTGISGQTTQQNHSLYAFRRTRWIGFFDVDEYINPQKTIGGTFQTIDILLHSVITKSKLKYYQVGGIQMFSKLFSNPKNLDETKYEFLKITECSKIIKHWRQKLFVQPMNVKIFCVHTIVSGLKTLSFDEADVFFNHYFFLNKKNRGKDLSSLNDNSILRFYSDVS